MMNSSFMSWYCPYRHTSASLQFRSYLCQKCFYFLLTQVCNLTWWTLTEEPQREIPLQKVSSVSHRSSQGKSLNIHATWNKASHHVMNSHLHTHAAVVTVWVTSCVCCVCVCDVCRIWANPAGGMWSGGGIVHLSGTAIRGDSSSQSSQC